MNYNSSTFSLILCGFLFIFFCLGFILDENSSGSGGYNGDLPYIWNNQLTFKNFSLKEAIDFTAEYNPEFFQSSKMPLSYVLNKYLNPYISNVENFRITVFVISCFTPIMFFFTLKKKYTQSNSLDLLLLSTFLFLNPFFRTSGYWALEENYGTLFLIISYFFFHTYFYSNEKIKFNIFFKIFLVTISSSICVYFDQKLTIIPLICFLYIIFSKKKNYEKITTFVLYIIFSIPCFYLIYRWKSFMPVSDSVHRKFGEIHFENIGYTIMIFAFYFFPLIFFKKKKYFSFSKIFNSKFNIIIIFSVFLYTIYFLFLNETEISKLGGGYAIKFYQLFIEDYFLIKFLLSITIIFSSLILIIFFNESKIDYMFFLFFIPISLIIYPMYQEYFDPLIVLLAILFFKTKLVINFRNNLIILSYYFVLLTSSIVYYF